VTKYLFRATIGPVQSLIMQARKLQDLYAGSYLLSHLCKNLISTAQMLGAEILYPKFNEERTSYPNLFVAIVDSENIDDLNKFANELEASLKERWRNIAENVLKHWKQEPTIDFMTQIETLLQFYWSAAEYNDGDDYRDKFLETLQRMGSAKATRAFSPLSEVAGRKCALTMEHNALFYRQCMNNRRIAESAYAAKCLSSEKCDSMKRKCEGLQLPEIPLKYLGRNEAIGAVAFVKRCLKFGIDEPDAKLYSFNDDFPDIASVAQMTQKAKEDSYYALVVFDGDNMGALYSSKPEEINNKNLQKFQQELSELVSESSMQMSQMVSEKLGNGVVVYAGGDDFLGAMCVEHVFMTLSDIRKSFRETIDVSEYTGKTSTFSAGIVIAHIMMPLGETLRHAREAEKYAKAHNNGEKDAYCLTILRRSGEITRSAHSFNLGADDDSMLHLHNLVDVIVENRVSTNFVYQLQTQFGRIFETPATVQCEMLKLEVSRILNRAELPNEIENKDAVICEIIKSVNTLIEVSNDELSNILELLSAVAFIARTRGGAR